MGSRIVGGPDRVLAVLASSFEELGSRLHLAVLDDGRTNWELLRGACAGAPMTLHAIDMRFRFDPAGVVGLERLARQIGAAILHSSDYKADLISRLAADRAGLPWVATLHGLGGSTHRLRLYAFLDRWALRQASAVFAVSQALAREHRQASLAVSLVPNVVSSPPAPPRGRVSRPRRVVSVGRLVPEKGYDVLLDALAEVRRELPDMTLTLVGDGPARPALEAQARRLGLDGQAVRFVGWRTDVVPLLDEAELFVLPSLLDNQPVALLEAFARGLPAVVTAVGEMPDLVDVPTTGLVVPPADRAALAAALRQAASSTLDGEAAWRRARTEHSAGRLAALYLGAYRRICAPQSLRPCA
jgi:glycosyltransferase involved in cell wall biosynthesis